ncbi:MAG: gamma carbonic anhydrase family protein [Planctomycetota bacterium]|nr:gamma carbonic anhydrase family protein [Planctomycetota bacterium]
MTESIFRPELGRSVYIAPTAFVAGQVTLGDHCSVWHHVMIRGDVAAIRIGKRVNIQDGAIVHTETDVDLDIADEVAIGHRAVVHCRRVGRATLIGIGAIVLDRAEIGEGCIVAAGALVPPGMKVPDGKVVMGVPAKIVRETTEDERAYHRHVVERYVQLAGKHAGGMYPNAAGEL